MQDWLAHQGHQFLEQIHACALSRVEYGRQGGIGVREHMVIHAFNGKTVNDLTRPEIMKVLDGPLDKKGNFVLTVLSGLETRKIAVPGTKTLEERKEKSLAPK